MPEQIGEHIVEFPPAPEGDFASIEEKLHELYPSIAVPEHHPQYLRTRVGELDAIIRGSTVEEEREDPDHEDLQQVRAIIAEIGAMTELIGLSVTHKLVESGQTTAAPESWGMQQERVQEYTHLLNKLDWSSLSTCQTDTLLGEIHQIFDDRRELYNSTGHKVDKPMPSALVILQSGKFISREKLDKLYANKESETYQMLSNARVVDEPRVIKVLSRIYPKRIDIHPSSSDAILEKLRKKYSPFEMLYHAIPDLPDSKQPMDVFSYEDNAWWAIDAALRVTGLSETLRNEYKLANMQLFRDTWRQRNRTYLDPAVARQHISKLHENVEAVGEEAIQKIYETFGTINFHNYKPVDLEYLVKLADKDEQYIQSLQAADVTVAFVDALGDYNGAFGETSNKYRKKDGATLVFEIKSATNIYRRMLMLRNLGVRPSTFVVGGHGDPGQITFGDVFNGGFQLRVNNDDGDISAEATTTVEGVQYEVDSLNIDRLLSYEFMQPNSSRTSDDSLHGRIQVIIESCSTDKPINAKGVTTATALLNRIHNIDVDLYAPTDTSYVTSDEESGTISFRDANLATIGSKVSLNERGEVERKSVDTVSVRRKETS